MALLLNLPNRNIDALLNKLELHIPLEDIEVYPNVKSPERIKLALVWDHKPGSLNEFENLQGIQSFGAGVDNILSDEERPEVPIARIVDEDLGLNMGNYVLTMINHHRLRLDMYQQQQELNLWKPRSNRQGKKVAVLGLGQIGLTVAEFLSLAGFEVTGWSQSEKQSEHIKSVFGEDAFEALIAESDYFVCLLPLTNDTRGIFNKHTFEKMRSDAVLINVARGGHVDEEDLIAALYDKEIAAAYIDVFKHEPLTPRHPFWRTPNLRITPHVSAVTNVETAVTQIVENYQRVMAGKPMLNTIDESRGY